MKTLKKLTIPAIIALIALLCAAVFIPRGSSAKADSGDYYDESTKFSFVSYSVTYDIKSDRTMDVTMDLTALYIGRSSTGFIYYIPVNAGDRVRNLNAYKLDGGEETYLEYTVENEENEFIAMAIDDYRIKTGEVHSYRIKYEYAITKPVSKNNIYLNAIGFDCAADITTATVVVKLPDGLQGATCYKGKAGTDDKYDNFLQVGNVIYLTTSLPAYNGITFDFAFSEGALSVKTDMTPYWIIIGACALFVVLFAVKFLFFNREDITPVPRQTRTASRQTTPQTRWIPCLWAS